MKIERGQIYFVNLNPIQGKEQAGTRPVLVLSINDLPLVVTVVVGTKGKIFAKIIRRMLGFLLMKVDFR
jgi:mRNA interferase MazF